MPESPKFEFIIELAILARHDGMLASLCCLIRPKLLFLCSSVSPTMEDIKKNCPFLDITMKFFDIRDIYGILWYKTLSILISFQLR